MEISDLPADPNTSSQALTLLPPDSAQPTDPTTNSQALALPPPTPDTPQS